MSSRLIRQTTPALISTIAIVAILVAVNYFASRHYKRYDLTEQKLYTISETTKKLLNNLNDVVNVTFYVSENIPPRMTYLKRYVIETMRTLEQMSNGKILFSIINPPADEKTETELQQKGIMKQQVNVISKEEINVNAVYFHVLVQHADKLKVIPFPNESIFEYEIASKLLEVTQKDTPIVCLASNDPDIKLDDVVYVFRERLGMGERYNIMNLGFSDENPFKIPEKCAALYLVATKDFQEKELYELDQYLMRGGTLVVFIQAVNLHEKNMMFQQKPMTNLTNLLKNYGLDVHQDLVSDYKSHEKRDVPAGQKGFITFMTRVPYPQWVVALNENFDEGNPALAYFQQLLFPFPCSITVGSSLPEGVKTVNLVKTTKSAKTQEGPYFDLQPPDPQKFKVPEDTKQYTLAAGIMGKIESYYKGKEIPKEVKDEKPNPNMPQEDDSQNKIKLDTANNARLFIIGTTSFLDVQLIQQLPQNYVQSTFLFLENLLDWLVLGEDLIAIRTKPLKHYSLKEEISDSDKMMAKVWGRFGMPIFLIILGVSITVIRKHNRKKLKELYSE